MSIKLLTIAILITAMITGLLWVFPAQALPVAAPNVEVITLNTGPITTTTIWAGPADIGPHENFDVFYVIDQTSVNTLTLTFQVSPDGSTWVNHSTKSAVVTDNAADATGYITGALEGVFYRITSTNGNTNTVTPTLMIVLR